MEIKDIIKMAKSGELDQDNDEGGTGGFWDLAYEIFGKTVTTQSQQELVERIYNSLWEIYKEMTSEDMEMLQRENKAMAEKLSVLGYSQDQISDICNGAI